LAELDDRLANMAPTTKKHTLVVWNPKRRYTIYKMLHYKTKKPNYVGQTGNEAKRVAAYRAAVKKELKKNEKIQNLVVGYVNECQDLGIPVNLVPLPEFPDGVPADRADGFEALRIHDLQTASACGTGGLNTSCGNCLALHRPRFDEYRAELAASGGVYVWSAADIAMRDAVAPQVVEAQAQLAALQDVQGMMREASDTPTPGLDKQVSDALVVVDDAMRKFMGPLQLAEALADKYEVQLGVLPVNAEAFKVDLNALRDKLKEQLVPDEDLLGLCKGASLMAKREVRAGFVAPLFRALAMAIQATEEDKLPDCAEVTLAKGIRQVLAVTGLDWLRDPLNKDVLPEERLAQYRFKKWKQLVYKKQGDDVPSHVAAMRFILRSHPEAVRRFDALLRADMQTKRYANSLQINAMLLDGYAHPKEPEFEGRKHWPGGAHGTDAEKLYQSMYKLFTRPLSYTQVRREACLKGLAAKWPERDAWWRQNVPQSDKEEESP
jgi:hypothetical protein